MKATLRHICLCRTANMSWRTCVVVKQIQSNPINIHGDFRAWIICGVQFPRYLWLNLVVTKLISRMGAFLVKLSSDECHRTPLVISQYWLEYTLHKSYFFSIIWWRERMYGAPEQNSDPRTPSFRIGEVFTYSSMIKTDSRNLSFPIG